MTHHPHSSLFPHSLASHACETRIFSRLPLDPGAIIEVARLPHGGNFATVHDTLRELPRHAQVDIQFRAVEPARIAARHGIRRLRCDAGRVRQNWAEIQARGRGTPEPSVIFI